MSLIAESKGLKFTGEMVTGFFINNGLQRFRLRFLELGFSNVNNFKLFDDHYMISLSLDIFPILLDPCE